uniref:Olfactory receptor n=1 Tax=Pelodiscus sinensis TaxID=13735 RepID=K7F8R9_PELSI
EISMENQTTLTEFVLLGLSSDPLVQIFLFLVFFVIYLFTLLANGFIVLTIRADFHLHTPMYFFLLQLSLVDTCYSSVTVPTLLLNLLSEHKTISVCGCIAQMFCIHLSAGAEVFTLSAMAYDRYAAICDPLRYAETMKKGICVLLGAGAWSMGFFNGLINTVFALQLHFCGNNQIHHFTCEFPPLLQLSCTSPLRKQLVLLIPALAFGLSSFLLILISYVHIISTVLRMRSVEGRRKAFSTCSSHLTVVGLFYVTGFIQYTKPSSVSSVVLEEMVSIHYSILTPLLNPVIYSLQNKEIKTALRKILQIRKCSSSK